MPTKIASDGERVRLEQSCEGCRELAARVERLEHALRLSQQEAEPPLNPLGTRSCYWICVLAHALFASALFTTSEFVVYGLMLSAGAVATMTVCQVFSTRPVHVRSLRSALSIGIVSSAVVWTMWIADVAEPFDILPLLFACYPPIFVSSWLVAKVFVWSRGWKIDPPGQSAKYPQLRIQHLMVCTLLVAAYLGIARMFFSTSLAWDGGEFLGMVLYGCVPTIISTTLSCLLARIILGRSGKGRKLGLAILIGGLALLMLCLIPMISLFFGEGWNWAMITSLSLTMLPLLVGVVISSGGTFAMMRFANYQLKSKPGQPVSVDRAAFAPHVGSNHSIPMAPGLRIDNP
ncbi:MAG: hypothetical protein AB8B91_10760 [Rubripirellula sp.]